MNSILYTISVKKIYTDIQSYITISVKVFDLTTYYVKNLINRSI